MFLFAILHLFTVSLNFGKGKKIDVYFIGCFLSLYMELFNSSSTFQSKIPSQLHFENILIFFQAW